MSDMFILLCFKNDIDHTPGEQKGTSVQSNWGIPKHKGILFSESDKHSSPALRSLTVVLGSVKKSLFLILNEYEKVSNPNKSYRAGDWGPKDNLGFNFWGNPLSCLLGKK